MILVTSAYGRIGHIVCEKLLEHGFEVRATDINKDVALLRETGVKETVCGDLRKKDFLKEVMRGIDTVVYVPVLLDYDEDLIANQVTDAAFEAGVKQFIQMSVCHPGLSTLLQHTKKLHAEEHLKLLGFKNYWNFTILQPLHYMQNVSVSSILETGIYPNFKPLDHKLGYVDAYDVAEAAAIVAGAGEKHKYATYELCGSDMLSINEIAEMVARQSGRTFETIYVPREELFESYFRTFSHADHDSYSRAAVQSIRDTYNDYGFAANPNILEWLLQRKPVTMEEYIDRELIRNGYKNVD